MTSRKSQKEVSDIQNVLDQNSFPKEYWNIEKWVRNIKMLRKRVMPDVLIEDDCESIGGEIEMSYPHIKDELRARIRSVVVKEFLA